MAGIHFTSPTGSRIFSAKNSWKGNLIAAKQSTVWKERVAGGSSPMNDFVKDIVAPIVREAGLNAEGTAALMQAMKGKIHGGSVSELQGVVRAALSSPRVADAAAKKNPTLVAARANSRIRGQNLRAALMNRS